MELYDQTFIICLLTEVLKDLSGKPQNILELGNLIKQKMQKVRKYPRVSQGTQNHNLYLSFWGWAGPVGNIPALITPLKSFTLVENIMDTPKWVLSIQIHK